MKSKYSLTFIRVGLESPYAAPTKEGIEENLAYAKACVRDSLKKNEAPYASHLFFTQEGILDDTIPEERELGIMAGKEWERAAQYTVVYVDRGISSGMQMGIDICKTVGRPVRYRSLGKDLLTEDGEKAISSLEERGIEVEK